MSAHRVRASFLPGRERTVAEGLRALSLHTLDLREGAVLERDCIYIVPLLEHLALRYRTSGSANPKSSTGPGSTFSRGSSRFTAPSSTRSGRITAGPLYAELSPRSFASWFARARAWFSCGCAGPADFEQRGVAAAARRVGFTVFRRVSRSSRSCSKAAWR